jgi:hypothetical protein
MKNYIIAIAGIIAVGGVAWWGYNYYHSPTRISAEDKRREVKINKK